MAVVSRAHEVDPVGACVGVRGSRIQNIVQELRGERIDIVVWSPEIAAYARNALAPAVISRIVVDESENLLEVTVPDDQLTNAIGRKGQNVKLAAKLLGWKIDIFSESRYNEANAVGRGLEQVASVAEISVEQLVAAGYNTLDSLRDASDEELADRLALSRSPHCGTARRGQLPESRCRGREAGRDGRVCRRGGGVGAWGPGTSPPGCA